MTKPILEVSDLWKSYPRRRSLFEARRSRDDDPFHAVRRVELELGPGECLGIVGESGSGKSTLVRMLAGLLAPSRGRILLQGKLVDLAGRGDSRSRIQMVFQDPTESLNPSFRVDRIIAEPLRLLHGMRGGPALSARVDELSDLVQLPRPLLERFPHQLSGGQRARVGIARALAPSPDVLILDEPTTALDVSVQARILLLLSELRARLGTSFLFVTHDLDVVRLLCDRVIVMKEGQIVEAGSVSQVIGAPSHAYTRTLIEALPQITSRRAGPRPRMIPDRVEETSNP
jgi:peptide/nickel transport system ATP-binding protein